MALHPTPQFRRRHHLDLSGPWSFAHDDADAGLDRGWRDDAAPFTRTIIVPFPPESRASGIGDTGEHPVVWYRRTFRRSDIGGQTPGGRILLHLGAVDYRAQVWINGIPVGSHEGGHVSFTLDVTTALRDGDEQVVVVRAEDLPRDLAQPRGKQFWEAEPRHIWYHRTTGIWQPVWLEAVPRTFIEELRWTPDTDRGMLAVQVGLNREPETALRVRLRLALGGELLADDAYRVGRRDTRREVGLEPAALDIGRARLLWSPGHPNLVDAQVRLEDASGDLVDEVHAYVGLRSVAARDGLFFLNGVPTYLRLVLSQGYWPESHLAAPGEDAIRREVELVKALGFNGVRNHQKVEDPRFLYECDRQGLVVWSEMASAYQWDARAIERFTREWLEVVRRDVSHPSIVTWVPFNESWGLPNLEGDPAQRAFVSGIHGLTRALDPTRPVIGNDGWEHVAADIWGIHDYGLDGAVLRARYGSAEAVERTVAGRPGHHRISLDGAPRSGQPVVLSEFGGIAFRAEPGTPWFGYGTVSDAEELVTRYDELVTAVLESPALAGFCYTQLTDTEQEVNGLLRADRTPKADPARIRAITRRPTAAIPGDLVQAAQDAGLGTASGGTRAG